MLRFKDFFELFLSLRILKLGAVFDLFTAPDATFLSAIFLKVLTIKSRRKFGTASKGSRKSEGAQEGQFPELAPILPNLFPKT